MLNAGVIRCMDAQDKLFWIFFGGDLTRFAEALCDSMELLELSDADVSEQFDAGISIVRRWKSGENTPSLTVCNLVVCWLIDEINTRIMKLGETK